MILPAVARDEHNVGLSWRQPGQNAATVAARLGQAEARMRRSKKRMLPISKGPHAGHVRQPSGYRQSCRAFIYAIIARFKRLWPRFPALLPPG
jgi:hypothetical protein